MNQQYWHHLGKWQKCRISAPPFDSQGRICILTRLFLSDLSVWKALVKERGNETPWKDQGLTENNIPEELEAPSKSHRMSLKQVFRAWPFKISNQQNSPWRNYPDSLWREVALRKISHHSRECLWFLFKFLAHLSILPFHLLPYHFDTTGRTPFFTLYLYHTLHSTSVYSPKSAKWITGQTFKTIFPIIAIYNVDPRITHLRVMKNRKVEGI